MTNEQYIDLLHESVKEKFTMFLDLVLERGWQVFINNTYRSFEMQEALYMADNRNAKPGRSRHNFGFAMDVNFHKNKTTLKKVTAKSDWLESGIPELASRCGLGWGGELYRSYYDPIHFEVSEPSTDELIALKQAQNVNGNKISFHS